MIETIVYLPEYEMWTQWIEICLHMEGEFYYPDSHGGSEQSLYGTDYQFKQGGKIIWSYLREA